MGISELRERLDSIKETNYYDTLRYNYYKIDENENLICDNIRGVKYGSLRKGYDEFVKQETREIGHSGEISLRPYTIKDSNGNIKEEGYVCESKIQLDESEKDKQLASLSEEVWELFCNSFGLNTATQQELVLDIMYLDEFSTKLTLTDRIKWYLTRLEELKEIEDSDIYGMNELTKIILKIGKLK